MTPDAASTKTTTANNCVISNGALVGLVPTLGAHCRTVELPEIIECRYAADDR